MKRQKIAINILNSYSYLTQKKYRVQMLGLFFEREKIGDRWRFLAVGAVPPPFLHSSYK